MEQRTHLLRSGISPCQRCAEPCDLTCGLGSSQHGLGGTVRWRWGHITMLDVLTCHHLLNFPGSWELPTWDLVG